MLPIGCHENQTILLSHATECLAKAAVALSEAAEAVAAAAKSIIPDTTNTLSVSQTPEVIQPNTENGTIVDYESNRDSSPITENLATPKKHINNLQSTPNLNNESISGVVREDLTSDTDNEEYLSAQSTLVQRSDSLAASDQSPVDDPPEIEAATHPPPSYRVLLDDEADVLLAACCLIRQSLKAVCYVRSSITTLDVYKALLDVVESPVHIIKSSSSQEIDRVAKIFQDNYKSVLLLPATQPPSFRINHPDSLVIHIGWPTNEPLYKQQIIDHQAEKNVFIAYSGDKDIYPSSSSILMHTQPWPVDQQLFKQACETLRPLFNKTLEEVPAKTKAKVYADWIITHGAAGPYHPPSWTPSVLVRRANLYLLDVLKYKPNVPAQSGVQITPPAVSAGFVASQKLESAVEEGVLRVKSSSGLSHISSLPHPSATPAGAESLNEVAVSRPLDLSILNPGLGSTSHYGSPKIVPGLTIEPENALSGSNVSRLPTLSASKVSSLADADASAPLDRVAEYLIIELDFDVVPSICHLATQPGPRNVLCFVKSLSTFEPLVGMLEMMVAKPVFSVRNSFSLSVDIKKALYSPSGCLILCDIYSQLPNSLKGEPISLNIHLGWVNNIHIYQDQTQQRDSTVILLRREVQPPNGPELVASLGQAGISQAGASTKRRYNRQTEDSTLAPGRNKWKELLSANTSTQPIRSAYMAWITHHCQGRHKEPEWSAVNVVIQANRYFKGLFRYGSDGDAFQERPMVTQGFVKHLGLETAVDAGLLKVKQ
ncbi:hypothetical protein OPQ81_002584 [Rhizoctonia solani]|nr:hypothetical protein OPQ81_002584 [Rhizoctonia solani]